MARKAEKPRAEATPDRGADPTSHPLLARLVRVRLKGRLREKGYGVNAAAAGVRQVSGRQITEAARKVKGLARGPVRGSFTDWLLQHLPDILKVVEALLPLVLAFLGPKGKKGGR